MPFSRLRQLFDTAGTLPYDATEGNFVGPLGVPELIVIFVIALLVFGPRRLPELGRTLGKAMNEFRKASNELKSVVEDEVREFERQVAQIKSDTEAAVSIPDDMHTSAAEAPAPPGVSPATAPRFDEKEKPADAEPGRA